jgi:hypothetical protein
VPQELPWLPITHFLEGEKLTSALVSRGAQPLDQFSFQNGVGILLRWRIDNVIHFYDPLLVQLRDHVIAFRKRIADSGQMILRLSLGEPCCWPFCSERREPNGYS